MQQPANDANGLAGNVDSKMKAYTVMSNIMLCNSRDGHRCWLVDSKYERQTEAMITTASLTRCVRFLSSWHCACCFKWVWYMQAVTDIWVVSLTWAAAIKSRAVDAASFRHGAWPRDVLAASYTSRMFLRANECDIWGGCMSWSGFGCNALLKVCSIQSIWAGAYLRVIFITWGVDEGQSWFRCTAQFGNMTNCNAGVIAFSGVAYIIVYMAFRVHKKINGAQIWGPRYNFCAFTCIRVILAKKTHVEKLCVNVNSAQFCTVFFVHFERHIPME